jgi:hypothetical protein
MTFWSSFMRETYSSSVTSFFSVEDQNSSRSCSSVLVGAVLRHHAVFELPAEVLPEGLVARPVVLAAAFPARP